MRRIEEESSTRLWEKLKRFQPVRWRRLGKRLRALELTFCRQLKFPVNVFKCLQSVGKTHLPAELRTYPSTHSQPGRWPSQTHCWTVGLVPSPRHLAGQGVTQSLKTSLELHDLKAGPPLRESGQSNSLAVTLKADQDGMRSFQEEVIESIFFDSKKGGMLKYRARKQKHRYSFKEPYHLIYLYCPISDVVPLSYCHRRNLLSCMVSTNNTSKKLFPASYSRL